MKKYLRLVDKATGEQRLIPARAFLNPVGSEYRDIPFNPKNFNQAFTLLMDLVEGGLCQNIHYSITWSTGTPENL